MINRKDDTSKGGPLPASPNGEEEERLLWAYIDGTCTAAEKGRVAKLIETDTSWGAAYGELLSFQAELTGSMELHEPRMRFTQNVMEAIAGTQPAMPMRRYINAAIMKGVAAVFIVSISITLLVVLFSADWSAPARSVPAVHLPAIDLSILFNSTLLYAAIGIAVILGLFFLDNTLRVMRLRHQQH